MIILIVVVHPTVNCVMWWWWSEIFIFSDIRWWPVCVVAVSHVDGLWRRLWDSLANRVSVPVTAIVMTISISVAIVRWVMVYNMNLSWIFGSRGPLWLICVGFFSNRWWILPRWWRVLRLWWIFWRLCCWSCCFSRWSFCCGRICLVGDRWWRCPTFRCLFGWFFCCLSSRIWWFRMGTYGGNFPSFPNRLDNFFGICPPNDCQLLLWEVNVEIIYTWGKRERN